MLSDVVVNALEDLDFVGFCKTRPYLAFGFCLGLCLTAWRVWRFTLLPLLAPDDPKELPYWIPMLGHVKSFFTNATKLMTDARLYFNDTREPFSVTAANSRLYVITKAEDVAAAYRNTTTFSFDIFIQQIMRETGVSEAGRNKMFQPPDPAKAIFPNPYNRPVARLAREMHIHQLFPGHLLSETGNEFIKYFETNLRLDSLAQRVRYVKPAADKGIALSLQLFTSDLFANAGQEVYFGKLLHEINPNMTWDFLEFDDLTWQVLYNYPRVLSRKMITARDRLIASMQAYFESPVDKRNDTVWFTPAMEKEMRALDTSDRDIACMMVTIYWGINTNTRKAAFWMFSYMLFEPELLGIVREETKAAFKEDGSVDGDHIMNNCPRLKGIWQETVRLTAFSSSIRYITDDTVIGGKVLRKGNRVVVPYRQLHFDTSVFGQSVTEFESKRFIEQPSLTRHPSWRPFGGGSTQCPGRFVAEQAAVVFVAMVLRRFNIELAPSTQAFPLPEEGNPVLGLMDPKKGCDLQVRLTHRV